MRATERLWMAGCLEKVAMAWNPPKPPDDNLSAELGIGGGATGAAGGGLIGHTLGRTLRDAIKSYLPAIERVTSYQYAGTGESGGIVSPLKRQVGIGGRNVSDSGIEEILRVIKKLPGRGALGGAMVGGAALGTAGLIAGAPRDLYRDIRYMLQRHRYDQSPIGRGRSWLDGAISPRPWGN